MYINVVNNTRNEFYFVIQKKTENICRMVPEVRDLLKKKWPSAQREVIIFIRPRSGTIPLFKNQKVIIVATEMEQYRLLFVIITSCSTSVTCPSIYWK